ncbi:MAG: PQQ-like beta-propeller repeat protein [Bacteroidetes bacterium]|nr:PQQ-like beta-propeller repeat protein [Bacteroidota bacterium]MCL6097523.1 PQQ-like beta-propeller repeat protein [Bacteroidota bacterium]
MKKYLMLLMVLLSAKIFSQTDSSTVAKDSIRALNADVVTKIQLSSPIVSTPLIWNHKIFAVDKSGTVSCYDSTAAPVWKTNLSVDITTKPMIADDVLIVGSVNGDIFAIDPKTGNQFQSIGLDRKISTEIIPFSYQGNIALAMPKSSGSKTAILFGTEDGKIHCYDLETLQEYWTNPDAKGTVSGAPVYANNKILFTSSDGFLYCIDANNGLLIWRWKESAESSFAGSNILTDGKTVYAVSNDNVVFDIDLLLGKLVWKSKNVNALPPLNLSQDFKTLFVVTKDKKLMIVSAVQGKLVKDVKMDVPFDSTGSIAIENGKKILFSRSGSIFQLNEKFKEEEIISLGASQINYFIKIDNDKFLCSNLQGTVVIFKLRQSASANRRRDAQ